MTTTETHTENSPLIKKMKADLKEVKENYGRDMKLIDESSNSNLDENEYSRPYIEITTKYNSIKILDEIIGVMQNKGYSIRYTDLENERITMGYDGVVYTDIDPTLYPLFENPNKWLGGDQTTYQTSLGHFGEVVDLTPEAIFFRASVDTAEDTETNTIQRWQENANINGSISVSGRKEAENTNNKCIWVEKYGDRVLIFERIPFKNRLTNPEYLKLELTRFCYNYPEWDNIFEASRQVAKDKGLIDEPDPIEEEKLRETQSTLEKASNENRDLLEKERTMLKQAQIIIENMTKDKKQPGLK